ncbi:hypothetical protein ACQPZJ_13080 [Actinoplanes sp. CA-054009]
MSDDVEVWLRIDPPPAGGSPTPTPAPMNDAADHDAWLRRIVGASANEWREHRLEASTARLRYADWLEALTREFGPSASAPEDFLVFYGWRTRIAITAVSVDHAPAWVDAGMDDSYPGRRAIAAHLADGTIVGWGLHQFRDGDGGLELRHSVWWPAAMPEALLTDLAHQLADEWRAFLRLAIEDVDSRRPHHP